MLHKQIKLLLIAIFLLVLGLVVAIGAQTKAKGKNTIVAKEAAFDEAATAAEFQKRCAVCHKPDGLGGNGVPNFTDPAFHRARTDARLFASITNGRGGMPSFKQTLRPEQIRALIRYVRLFPTRAKSDEKPVALETKTAGVG